MENYRPKISVIVITYNQEELICRALNSLLCQKEFIYEIIISDDCSKDNTWNVIQDYKLKHPTLIKAYSNEGNLGVYGNLQKNWNRVSGDIIFTLAGDDVFCEKIFENTINLIEQGNLDFHKEDFVVLFDFKTIDKEGNEKIFSNSQILRNGGLSLKLRGLIFNRSMGLSLSIVKKRFSVEGSKHSVSYAQESIIDLQPHMFAKKYLYMPYVGSIYYTQIGASIQIDKNHRLHTRIDYCNIIPEIIKDLSKADHKWIKYEKNKTLLETNPNILQLLKYFWSLIKITNLKFGIGFIKREYKIFIKTVLSLITKPKNT